MNSLLSLRLCVNIFSDFPHYFRWKPTLTLLLLKLYYDCTTMLAPSL